MAKRPKEPPIPHGTEKPASKKVYKSLNRSIVFPAKRLENEEDIKAYIEEMQDTLQQLLKNCDGIDLK